MIVHLTSAALLTEASGPTFAAMVKVPPWLVPYTLGRPAWSYAVGESSRLLWAALGERRRGVDGGSAVTAYRAALDERWAACVERGRFAAGAWMWAAHGSAEPAGPVPDGAVLVCTCRPAQGCHLQWLAPWLVRAGHEVRLYGAPFTPR